MTVEWDVEVRLQDTQTGEELDYMTLPYKSDHINRVFTRVAKWYPLNPPIEARLTVKQRATGKEIDGKIVVAPNGHEYWVAVSGVVMRPRDAIRALMARVEDPRGEASSRV